MSTYIPTGGKFIYIFSACIIAAVALWYAYRLADGGFLSEMEATGKVVGKEHVPFSEKYQMQNIGGLMQNVKITIPETWLLTLDLSGARAQASVPYDEFKAVPVGAEVKVKYKKRRLSGNLQVTQYSGRTGG